MKGYLGSKTNSQLTRRKRARHLMVVLTDSVPFVEVFHSIDFFEGDANVFNV